MLFRLDSIGLRLDGIELTFGDVVVVTRFPVIPADKRDRRRSLFIIAIDGMTALLLRRSGILFLTLTINVVAVAAAAATTVTVTVAVAAADAAIRVLTVTLSLEMLSLLCEELSSLIVSQ